MPVFHFLPPEGSEELARNPDRSIDETTYINDINQADS